MDQWAIGCWLAPQDLEQLPQLVFKLINDPSRRQLMARNGQQLVDGQGALRVARCMMENLVCFRSATQDDAQRLWDWRNDEVTRAASFSPPPTNFETHVSWLLKKIRSPDCELMIAESLAGEPLGQVRLDFDSSRETSEISIGIAPHLRGRGLGAVLIQKASRMALTQPHCQRVEANIKSDNVASQKAFQKCGYRLASNNRSPHLTFWINEPAITLGRRASQLSKTG